ncbi:MAG: Quinolinate phosphoribosyltransferase [decarboxylating] [Ignavibacteriae bacterium]|nr:MAG: Quinolinate phosphoribosyltransferase [decarboxylating] [Ignavibacteriota bacterium]
MNQILNDSRITRLIQEALAEDIGLGDITTESIIDDNATGAAEIILKENAIIAGIDLADIIFRTVDAEIYFQKYANDGSFLSKNTKVAKVEGNLGSILKAERTVLNFMQRMSGIATLTRQFVNAITGTNAKITDTRKTAPGLRLIDKLAVKIGGGVNHRFGLDDMILIKDNHIAAAGGIEQALNKCLSYFKNSKLKYKIEIETKNLEEVKQVLKIGNIDRIMLDNFSIPDMTEAVKIINKKFEVEASGNIRLENVLQVAETGVDFISIGYLTHSPKAIDISMEIIPNHI